MYCAKIFLLCNNICGGVNMKALLMIMLVISAVAIVGLVMAQPSKNQGLSGLITGGSNENYFAKNKVKTKEKTMARMTIVAAVIFLASVVGLNFV